MFIYNKDEANKKEGIVIFVNYERKGIYVKNPLFFVKGYIGELDKSEIELSQNKISKVIFEKQGDLRHLKIDKIDKYLIELKNEIGDKKITIWKLWKYEKKVRNDAKRILGEFDE